MICELRILFILKNPVNPVHSLRALAETTIKAHFGHFSSELAPNRSP